MLARQLEWTEVFVSAMSPAFADKLEAQAQELRRETSTPGGTTLSD